jgi:S-formylglutathione hydrolase FrmB
MRFTLLLFISLLPFARAADYGVVDSKTLADGTRQFHLRTAYQPEPTLIRVFADDSARAARPQRILYVLPVQAREERKYGDGFDEMRKLGVKGWIVVAPSFAQIPWYADHPTDPLKRQESYFLKAVVPFIDAQFPGDARQRCLLGFSKSGWGAYSLLLRHPDLFYAASAWDAPLMKDTPDQFQMQEIFGTQVNFEPYCVSALLKEKAPLLRERKRLYLAGYGGFLKHTQDAQALLDELRIPHDYRDIPKRDHIWGSGWLIEAVQALDALTALK